MKRQVMYSVCPTGNGFELTCSMRHKRLPGRRRPTVKKNGDNTRDVVQLACDTQKGAGAVNQAQPVCTQKEEL